MDTTAEPQMSTKYIYIHIYINTATQESNCFLKKHRNCRIELRSCRFVGQVTAPGVRCVPDHRLRAPPSHARAHPENHPVASCSALPLTMYTVRCTSWSGRATFEPLRSNLLIAPLDPCWRHSSHCDPFSSLRLLSRRVESLLDTPPHCATWADVIVWVISGHSSSMHRLARCNQFHSHNLVCLYFKICMTV